MAQNINEVYPIDEYTILKRDANGYFIVDQPHQLIFPLIKAVQQLEDQVSELKQEIERLRGNNGQ
jgi:TolA-binding protein